MDINTYLYIGFFLAALSVVGQFMTGMNGIGPLIGSALYIFLWPIMIWFNLPSVKKWVDEKLDEKIKEKEEEIKRLKKDL